MGGLTSCSGFVLCSHTNHSLALTWPWFSLLHSEGLAPTPGTVTCVSVLFTCLVPLPHPSSEHTPSPLLSPHAVIGPRTGWVLHSPGQPAIWKLLEYGAVIIPVLNLASTPLTPRGNPLLFTETQHGVTKSIVIWASQTRVQGLALVLVWDALGRWPQFSYLQNGDNIHMSKNGCNH